MPNEDFRHKIITDPVHGDIGLSQLETDIIDTSTFQRLRHINQLGLASLVYPDAGHSRFAHSIGVLHMMNRITNLFINRKKIDMEAVKKLRIAALLHDIGHYPYSHLMESVVFEASRESQMKKQDQNEIHNSSTIKRYPTHEHLGELIITRRKEIKDLLERNNLDPAEISAIILGSAVNEIPPSLPNLLHSSLDVDRMDYLVRDSINTGVPYGRIDTNYILNNLDLDDEDQVVILSKAQTAVEHFLIARYFMFKSVYRHHTVTGFEGVMRNIISLLHQANKIYPPDDIKGMITSDSQEFFNFHDGYIDKQVDEYADIREVSDLPDSWRAMTTLCQSIKFRKRPQLVHEAAYLHIGEGTHVDEKYSLFTHNKTSKLKELCDQFNIPEFCWIWEEPKDIKFEALGPDIPLSKAQEIKPGEMRELIKVKNSKGHIELLLEDNNSIIKTLSALRQKMSRLYVVGASPAQLVEIKKEVQSWLKQ